MPEETPNGAAAAPVEKPVEETIPYARWEADHKKAKEAQDKARKLETEMAELRAQMEERESAGLPELERMKKDLERAAKRAEEAEQRAEQHERALTRTTRERWVTAAAKDFTDPADASAFLDLDSIEDEKDAERAVKALAKRKPHLLKAEEPNLPGRVLANGQRVPANGGNGSLEDADRAAAESFLAEINAIRSKPRTGGSLFGG